MQKQTYIINISDESQIVVRGESKIRAGMIGAMFALFPGAQPYQQKSPECRKSKAERKAKRAKRRAKGHR